MKKNCFPHDILFTLYFFSENEVLKWFNLNWSYIWRFQFFPDLIPGTFYSVQVSATTRGGLGVPSKAIHFQTSGELPKLDSDELEGIEIPESKLASNIDNQNVDFFEDEIKADDLTDSIQQANNPPFYVLPSRVRRQFIENIKGFVGYSLLCILLTFTQFCFWL